MSAKKRKIVQIAVASPAVGDGEVFFSRTYALCDDGTLWVKMPDAERPDRRGWEPVEDVPQPIKTARRIGAAE